MNNDYLYYLKEKLVYSGSNEQLDKCFNDYDDVFYPDSKFPIVKKNELYNYLGRNGKLIYDKWFDYADYMNKYSIVKSNNLWNVIDIKGNYLPVNTTELSKKCNLKSYIKDDIVWFQKVRINEGIRTIKLNNEVNFLDENGNLISKKWFKDGGFFHSNVVDVELKNQKNTYMRKDGTLFNHTYRCINWFENGLCLVMDNNFKYHYIDVYENIIFDLNGEHDLTRINGIFIRTEEMGSINVLYDINGHEVCQAPNSSYDKNGLIYFNDNTCMNSKLYNVLYKYEGNLYHYYDVSGDRVKELLYKPYYNYGNYILCGDSNNTFLYDKKSDDYITIFNNDINKCDSLIKDRFLMINHKYYYILDNVIELPLDQIFNEQELSKFIDDENFNEVNDLLSEDDYLNKKGLHLEIAHKLNIELNKENDIKKQVENACQDKLNYLFSELSKIGNTLHDIENSDIHLNKVSIEDNVLLINVGNHKEINPIFLTNNLIYYMDLSMIDFTNVLVSGLDLSNTNAFINPQLVFDKDMSNGNYSGLFFGSSSFNGVNITNSTFNCDFINLDDAINNRDKLLKKIK